MRGMVRLLIVLGMAATGVAPATAARLCRDGKGLFTPCIGVPAPGGTQARREDRPAARDAAAPAAARDQVRRRPVVARTRLCRDTKGLFTPCPR